MGGCPYSAIHTPGVSTHHNAHNGKHADQSEALLSYVTPYWIKEPQMLFSLVSRVECYGNMMDIHSRVVYYRVQSTDPYPSSTGHPSPQV